MKNQHLHNLHRQISQVPLYTISLIVFGKHTGKGCEGCEDMGMTYHIPEANSFRGSQGDEHLAS
jgi:hypothetical protein